MDATALKERTTGFAHRSVKLAVTLPKTVWGTHLRNQLIRCATSVAANYRATLLAQTKAAFISKVRIRYRREINAKKESIRNFLI